MAVLQEWICRYPIQDVDKLRHRLIDRETVIDQAIDRWRFWPMAWVMARCWHFKHLT